MWVIQVANIGKVEELGKHVRSLSSRFSLNYWLVYHSYMIIAYIYVLGRIGISSNFSLKSTLMTFRKQTDKDGSRSSGSHTWTWSDPRGRVRIGPPAKRQMY